MVREHYLHPTLVKMAMEASDIFHNFGDAIGGDARFTQTRPAPPLRGQRRRCCQGQRRNEPGAWC